jgi:Fe-S cluster assembly ATP-binding protein
MLHIQDLKVARDSKEILKGVDLNIKPGEVHAIMGPNGSGKSTLASTIAGAPDMEVLSGSIQLDDHNILDMDPSERAQAGVFLGFQYPVEIPGVNNLYFLKSALNSLREAKGEEPLDAYEMMALVKEKAALIGLDKKYLERGLNEGFSGGEKKRNEILQMLVLDPKLAVLDEIDSGLDIDALGAISNGINAQRDKGRSILLVTHYQRLLDHVRPDVVHVLKDGKIVKTGGFELVKQLESEGYAWLNQEDPQA